MTLDFPDAELTHRIIGCAYTVHGELGAGFLERIYENAMVIVMQSNGLAVRQQAPIPVTFRGRVVGEYFADLLVENKVICELKAKTQTTKTDEAQLINYLTATHIDTGLLINFGASVEIRRNFRQYKNPVNPEKSH